MISYCQIFGNYIFFIFRYGCQIIMEELVKNGLSFVKKVKVEKEGNGFVDENSYESGGFVLFVEEEKNNDLFD